MRRHNLVLALLVTAACHLDAQQPQGTLVMAVRQEPTAPVPYLGPPTSGNSDVADQLFLRLAGLGSTARTTGDDAMVPELARKWTRRDSVTVDFELDPRARWHDGRPVTSADVLLAWSVIHTPSLAVDLAPYDLIADVTARDSLTVRVRFSRPSSEQVYTAGFLLQPLPAHLLGSLSRDSLRSAPLLHAPVGNGPYRYVRRVPGQLLELEANPRFFLGTPGIGRLIFRYVPSTDAQVNLLLAGQTDVMSDVPASALSRIAAAPDLTLVTAPGSFVTYLLFNAKSPGDSSHAHPILADRDTRHALAQSLDVAAIASQAFGPGVQTPRAVRSQAWYWVGGDRDPGRPDTAAARRSFRAAGWGDHDGDGVLDRAGQPLELTLIYPVQSSVFAGIAVQVEQSWRRMGVRLRLEPIDGAVWLQRRAAGRFDVDIAGVHQDPSPASLVQSWSCDAAAQPGSSNVGKWCDPTFDRLRDRAATLADPVAGYRAAFEQMAAWQPAVVIGAPANRVAVHRRFENVIIRASKAWTSLWRWRIRPGALLPRDR